MSKPTKKTLWSSIKQIEHPEVVDKFAFPKGKPLVNELHPIYKRYLTACWDLQEIWGSMNNELISGGKARELSSVAIHQQVNRVSSLLWEGGPMFKSKDFYENARHK